SKTPVGSLRYRASVFEKSSHHPASLRPVSDHNQLPENPPVPAEAIPPTPSRREKAMGFWEHVDELRGTIIKSLVAFLIFAVLVGYFASEFNHMLLWPLHYVAKDYP